MKYTNVKFRSCTQIMLALVLTMFTLQMSGQTVPGKIINSWFGNSNPDAGNHMPQGMEGMFVSPDGSVYTNVPWEEGGAGFVQIKDGVVKHGAQSLGWGAMGGRDVAANSKYVYFTNTKGNEGGGLTGGDYPPKGDYWLGVLRVSKTNIGLGAPFTGGKGFGGIHNSTLVVLQPGDSINANLTGICATETELFVGCDYDKKIRVYDATTMAFKREWTVTDPYQMAVDAQGMLWVAVGFEATKIERYNVNGIKQAQEINLAAGSLVGDFCIDKDNRMLIGDVGQREQVLIYTNINTTPAMTSTFGTQFGVYSGVPGKMAPLKFHQVRGIGTDNAGNIYIGNTQWHSGGQGIVLESYTPAGSINWSRYCTMFVDACGADQVTDAQDIYGQVEHFTVDFSKPAGQEATLSAYTLNRYKYPEDPRLKSLAATASMRTYKGKKFLVTIPQSAGRPLTIYRFNAATDGEVAIPCVMWGITDGNNQSYPDAPQGTWLWRDLNANGQMDNDEFISTEFDAFSSVVDKDMTVWMASTDILSVVCDGLDANGVPMYEPKLTKTSKPTPFMQVRRLRYVPENDVMYLGGVSAEQPELNYWGNMGSVLCRYNDWSKGNRTKLFEIVLPSDVKAGPCTQSFDVADDYLFTSISVGRAPFLPGEIRVYHNTTGAFVGKIVPPAAWHVGWNDMAEVLNVTKRSNGEYIIIQEEDGRNKNIMLRWSPGIYIPIYATGVKISLTSATLAVNETTQLTGTVAPSNASNQSVSWSSSNTSIATVNAKGVVTGVSAGSTVIIVTSGDGGKTATCAVTVTSPLSGLSGNVTAEFWFDIVGTEITDIPLTDGDTTSILTSIEIPSNAMDNYLTRVRGYIIPLKSGSYNFYIASDDNGQLWLSTNNMPTNKTLIASVSDWTESRQWAKFPTQMSEAISLVAGTRYYFEAIMKEGSGGDNLAVAWKGADIKNITVISGANLDKYVEGANVAVASVTLNPGSESMKVNEGIQLFANVLPSNAENQSVTWSSSDSNIANVSSTGMVTAKATGTATITVTTADGSKTATCIVTVKSTVGITENSLNNLVSIYPNPATDIVYIDLGNSSDNGAARVQIVDLLGKQVYLSGEISQTPVLQINTSQFGKGIYIVNITKGSEKICKKLIIQ